MRYILVSVGVWLSVGILCVAASTNLFNDTGSNALALRVQFSEPVEVQDVVSPLESSVLSDDGLTATFVGGVAHVWASHWFSWSPSSAEITGWEWLADPADSFAVVSGIVVDRHSTPVARAKLRAQRKSNGFEIQFESDSSGFYTISLPPGEESWYIDARTWDMDLEIEPPYVSSVAVVSDPLAGQAVTADLALVAVKYSPMTLLAGEPNDFQIEVYAAELFAIDGFINLFVGISSSDSEPVTEEALRSFFPSDIEVIHVDTTVGDERLGGISVRLELLASERPRAATTLSPKLGWDGWLQIYTQDTLEVAHYFAAVSFGRSRDSSIRIEAQ